MRYLWLICLVSWGIWGGMGCRKSQLRAEPPPPRSDQPTVRLRSHKGIELRYDIYNTSPRAFEGMAIVIEGEGCDGPRDHRLFVRLETPPLQSKTVRPFVHNMPYACRTFQVKAYDLPMFQSIMQKRHRPLVRYAYKGRYLMYEVQNNSILPFQGLAVVIRATGCEGPQPKRYWLDGARLWLYPGYKRTYKKDLGVDCSKVHVAALDLVEFVRRRQAFIRAQREQQKKIRDAARKLLGEE